MAKRKKPRKEKLPPVPRTPVEEVMERQRALRELQKRQDVVNLPRRRRRDTA